MERIVLPGFDLAATVRSGHLFAYEELSPASFRIVNGDSSFLVEQRGEELRYEGIDEGALRFFFDLDRDLPEMLHALPGIRLVRQEVRQAILTFIMTANNNQVRIKRMMDAFRELGGGLLPKQGSYTAADLWNRGFGYRADYLERADRLLTPGYLRKLRQSDFSEAKELLLSLPGVGPKVAECILAYSELAFGEAFPVDLWVARALKRWHAGECVETVRKSYGNNAAYAQHYLFLAAQEAALPHDL